MAGSLIGRGAATLLSWVAQVFRTWRFPVFALSLVVGMTAMMVAILFIPNAPEGLGAFAEDFKVWCFGYDPATGRFESMYVVMMVLQPIILGTILLGVWWRPLREGLATARRQMAGWSSVPLVLVAISGATFPFLGWTSEARGELPFPAERLRMAHTPPAIDLVNQRGERVTLDAMRGKVVIVTAVYASCGLACPSIMAQSKRVVNALPPERRDDVRVVGVTLDPERDDVARLARMAEAQHVEAPLFNLVTGASPEVNATLDALQIARRLDPETGIIDHANLFLLVDRKGRLAYRFTLGDRQERWLATALGVLLAEAP